MRTGVNNLCGGAGEPSTARSIPVRFIASPVAVDLHGALAMLSLDGPGKTESGARKAFQRIRAVHKIPKLPGGVFPVKAIERAASESAECGVWSAELKRRRA